MEEPNMVEKKNLEEIPGYRRGMPYRPIYETDFLDELKATWGEEWGVKSAFGKIRKIMVHRPAEEQTHPLIRQDPQLFNLPEGVSDLGKLQAQHDRFVEVLKAEGIDIVYLEPKAPLIGSFGIPLRSAIFTREAIVVRGGAIISRSASAYKKGLEVFQARRLMELGCPILHTVHGRGVFETSNMVWVDDDSVILATGMRGNEEGRNQVEHILRGLGVREVHYTQLPGYLNTRTHQVGPSSGMFHLDMCFGMANPRVAVLWPGGVGYDTIKWLQNRDVDIIEVSENELHTCAPNLLVVSPNRVIVSAMHLRMTEHLRKRGIDVIELDLSEFARAGGGPTCMTLTLIRE